MEAGRFAVGAIRFTSGSLPLEDGQMRRLSILIAGLGAVLW